MEELALFYLRVAGHRRHTCKLWVHRKTSEYCVAIPGLDSEQPRRAEEVRGWRKPMDVDMVRTTPDSSLSMPESLMF